MLEEGLRDICVSRFTGWGIPLPGHESANLSEKEEGSQVIYVWFEALLNYLSGLDESHPNDSDDFYKNCTHFIGKDISRFHAIYLPAILLGEASKFFMKSFSFLIQLYHLSPCLALNNPLFSRLCIHGWFVTKESSQGFQKMSKSIGNVISPFHLLSQSNTNPTFSSDQLRFALVSQVNNVCLSIHITIGFLCFRWCLGRMERCQWSLWQPK